MNQNPDPIRDSVRKRYAEHARAGSSCCGESSCCSETTPLYPEQLLSGLPSEVANFSLGCGGPLAAAALQPGETVLDLGSGGGLDCFLAAKQVGETGRVLGVDMTPEMLDRARAAADRLGVRNVDFRQGFLESLPIEDASVDVIISNCVINLSPDKPQVFREMFRVLKPGGRVSISDTVTDGPLPENIRQDMEAWGACLAGALEVGEYIRGLTEAGFVDVEVQPKGDAGDLVGAAPLKGKIFSARITARKPL